MFERILLAVDGSEKGYNAAHVAADLTHAMKSESLRIVICFGRIPPYLGEPNLQEAIDARLAEAQMILQHAVKIVGNVPAEVHTELIEGDPAEAIIDVARTCDCNLIIMGSRGLGGLAGLVLGSTSQKVVSHAP